MNIHHLELFYYVARHGGITEAVRNIPYGIQQPAVSGQVAQLEEFLGVVLFQRRPFELTAAGDKLYKFIAPFFSNLDKMAAELQGGKTQHLRIGASAVVLREHLPSLFQDMRRKYPGLRVSLRELAEALDRLEAAPRLRARFIVFATPGATVLVAPVRAAGPGEPPPPEAPGRHKQTAHYAAWRDAVEFMQAEPRHSIRLDPLGPDRRKP